MKSKLYLEIKQAVRKLRFKTAAGPRVKEDECRRESSFQAGEGGEERSRRSVTVYTAPPAARSIRRNEN